MKIEEVLRTCIENCGQNDSGISRATGIPKVVLSRFKYGKQSLRLETAEKLMKYFGISCIVPKRLREPLPKVRYNKTKKWRKNYEENKKWGRPQALPDIIVVWPEDEA